MHAHCLSLPLNHSAYKEALVQLHNKHAVRLLHVCERNGGVYTKAAQFGSALQAIPPEYKTYAPTCTPQQLYSYAGCCTSSSIHTPILAYPNFNARPTIPPLPHRVLEKMQDKAPPRPFDQVQRVIQQEFGQPIDHLFVDFDPTPAAAASLAQVHRATVRLPPITQGGGDDTADTSKDGTTAMQGVRCRCALEVCVLGVRCSCAL